MREGKRGVREGGKEGEGEGEREGGWEGGRVGVKLYVNIAFTQMHACKQLFRTKKYWVTAI